MKAFLLALAIALPATAAHSQSTAITVWPKGMPPGGITQKVDFGNHLLEITHREKDGRAELHKTKADVMVIQSGTATIVWGGEVIDPAPTAPNEIQGSGIKGGQSRKSAPATSSKSPPESPTSSSWPPERRSPTWW